MWLESIAPGGSHAAASVRTHDDREDPMVAAKVFLICSWAALRIKILTWVDISRTFLHRLLRKHNPTMEKYRPALSPTQNKFGNRVPKQVQRCLPLYLGVLFFLILITNLDLLTPSSADVAKRGVGSKKGVSKAGSALATIPDAFPKKIWQTWKVDVLAFEERDLGRARTWTANNPGYRYEVLTDNNDMYYVETHFGPEGLDRPDIVDMYRALTARIIKADLLRYLIMYVEGGVYADIDVENLKPIDRWLPKRFSEKEVDIVIGVEVDEPTFAMHPILGQKSRSFCQWTFMSKPGNPFMLRLIDGILAWLNGIAKKEGKEIGEIVLDFDEVLTGTGPSAFTTAALAEMSAREGKDVTWETFHNLDEAILIQGMLVLNVEAFAAGQGHSDSGNHKSRFALVKHRYHASAWTDAHPRHTHPAYGEVEKCNWNPECVAMWDVNVAAYDQLSETDKAKLIEIKKANDEVERVKAEQESRFLEALEKQEAAKPKFDMPVLEPGPPGGQTPFADGAAAPGPDLGALPDAVVGPAPEAGLVNLAPAGPADAADAFPADDKLAAAEKLAATAASPADDKLAAAEKLAATAEKPATDALAATEKVVVAAEKLADEKTAAAAKEKTAADKAGDVKAATQEQKQAKNASSPKAA